MASIEENVISATDTTYTAGDGGDIIEFNPNVADSTAWTNATLPSTAYWYSVCYGNGKFVAVAWNSDEAAYSDSINIYEITNHDKTIQK